jgi:hypothetical protein
VFIKTIFKCFEEIRFVLLRTQIQLLNKEKETSEKIEKRGNTNKIVLKNNISLSISIECL